MPLSSLQQIVDHQGLFGKVITVVDALSGHVPMFIEFENHTQWMAMLLILMSLNEMFMQ